MKTSWWVRTSVLLVFIVLAVLVLLPTVMKFDENGHYPIKSKINLGLDLQGGLYMIMGIDFKKVYKDEVKTYARKIELALKDQEITITPGAMDESDQMDPKQVLVLTKATDMDAAKKKIKEFYPGLVRITKDEGDKLEIALAGSIKKQIEEQSVGKSIEVIRNRIDEFGVTEPEILAQGNDRIVVQLPGVRDIERAKELIGKTAKLEFKLVNDKMDPQVVMGWLDKATKAGISYKKGDRFSDYLKKMNEFLKAEIPEGHELAFEKKTNKATGEEVNLPYVVETIPRITGDDLADARVQIDPQKMILMYQWILKLLVQKDLKKQQGLTSVADLLLSSMEMFTQLQLSKLKLVVDTLRSLLVVELTSIKQCQTLKTWPLFYEQVLFLCS